MVIKNVRLKIGDIDLESINFNQLTILVGANGTGKTLVLKMNYIMPNVANIISRVSSIKSSGLILSDDVLYEEVQKLFDGCFDSMDFTGECRTEIQSKSGKSIIVYVQYIDGKIVDISSENIEEWQMTLPLYMSSEARLFSFLNGLLPYMPKPDDSDQIQKWETLMKVNKIYNVTYAMMWAAKCPYTIPDQIKQSLKEGYDLPDQEIPNLVDIDYEKYQVFGLFGESNQKKNLSIFGNGHQALYNMFISSSMAGS